MTDDRMKELIKRLHEQTISGRVVWGKTTNKAIFQASFPTYAIRISPRAASRYSTAETIYEVSIYDKEGDEVERVDTDVDDSSALPLEVRGIVADLYSRARRMALDVDQALDTLLETLASR